MASSTLRQCRKCGIWTIFFSNLQNMNPLIIQYFLKKKSLEKLTGIINFANVNVEIPKNASLMLQFWGRVRVTCQDQ
jgi:hypothetical protein